LLPKIYAIHMFIIKFYITPKIKNSKKISIIYIYIYIEIS